ncbi:MAG: rhodanese-like domain-containing protein [Deltaproteobacteria bacterium]|nr:rhodanese-like domain-containing protein [Deltaproteobacteria bacterium]
MTRLVAGFMFFCLVLPMAGFAADAPPTWWQQAEAEAERDGYVLLTPVEFDYRIRHGLVNFLLVDVRPGYEYERGHLDGAVNFEFNLADRLALKPSKRTAFESLLGPEPNRTIVFYCRSFR